MNKAGAFLLGINVVTLSIAHAEVSKQSFGRAAGENVDIYTLRDASGIEARIMTYGATIVSLKTRDRHGQFKNIVLGFDSVDPYLAGVPYFGATVGRYANRIANGKFSIDGKEFQLPTNDGPNSLHGGVQGFDKRVWTVEQGHESSGTAIRLKLTSPAGDQGYPGELTAYVTYRLEGESLSIDFEAKSTAATPINLANHAYFNLTGEPDQTILDHRLLINAEQFTPVNATLIPTGERTSVAGTPFDFRQARAIGERINLQDTQLSRGKGYDHNWILARAKPRDMERAALLMEPKSGRTLEILTTQPGLQFYSGNFMDGKPAGQGSVFKYRTGLCLETQHFPDSPNQPAFPSTILKPGELYSEKTVLIFGVEGQHRPKQP